MVGERRRTQDGARSVSPSDLSSPPRSSPEAASPAAKFQNNFKNSPSASSSSNNNNNHSSIIVNPSGVALSPADQKPPRKKPGRKPGSTNKPKTNADSPSTSTNANTDAPPKVRKQRKPKDPNAPPVQRKKRNTASDVGNQLDIRFANDIKLQAHPSQTEAPPHFHGPVLASQSGKHEDIQQRPIQSFFNPPPSQSQHSIQLQQNPSQETGNTPKAIRTSGQNYDPIRSNYDPVRETSHNPFGHPQTSPSHAHSINRASASPSISSLVDPPNHALASPSIATQSFYQHQQSRFHQTDGHSSVPPSPTLNRVGSSAPVELGLSPQPGPVLLGSQKPEPTHAAQPGPSTMSKKMAPASNAPSSTAASPKAPKAKASKETNEIFPEPPPLPGSGLMGIGGGGPADGTEFRAPTVVLRIPMTGEVNNYINFTQLAEEQYGWDALHPRLAAQRDRLARVAAAGAALERSGSNKESGDEMSLDSEAEGEGEGSNVDMGGMSDGRTGTDGGKKVPRKRKMKEDEYDKDDGFVDDTELLWEEHAATANDGFFVYSGPLVPEGEKPTLETRGDGAPKRGRGRGSRGGRGLSRGASLLAGQQIPVRPNGLPAHGPGSRGGLTTRKPRITKADRARMEQEKLEREKMGNMASMPGGYGSMPHLASAPSNLGATPLVFNQ
ncbi:hypothetical protein WAI453_006664 [Rhynchosporium graminicola]|uniref:Related to HPC2 Cell cycle regulatory protein n=1 Tax=Rhynchosporium graminicola TaxID=2792576 RepID=A0A1E1K387_9HELO|nr:related to HPC2 Cell cycle regulatory protein [Rhynchosporium commune]